MPGGSSAAGQVRSSFSCCSDWEFVLFKAGAALGAGAGSATLVSFGLGGFEAGQNQANAKSARITANAA